MDSSTGAKPGRSPMARDADARYMQAIMQSSVAAVTVLAPDGRIVYANERAEQILGLSPSQIEGRSYDDPGFRHTSVDGGPFPDEEMPFTRVRKTKQPVFDVRHGIEWPDGTRRILSINGAPVLDERGEIELLVFQVVDITKEYEAEKHLREREQLVRDICNTAPAIIWTSDLDKNVDFVNDWGLRFGNVEMADVTGQKWKAFVHPEERDAPLPELDPETGEPRLIEREVRLRGADGNWQWFCEQTRIRLNAAGDPAGLIGVLVNIDQVKQAAERELQLEREVAESRKMESLGILAAGVAHDFNNMLMGISGSADLALMNLDHNTEAAQDVNAILDVTEKARELCRQMLLYSGREPFRPVRLDAEEVTQKMEPLLRSAVPSSMDFRMFLSGEMLPVEADPSHLRQILMNLVLNGAEAIGDGTGSIVLSCHRATDNGLMKDPDTVARLTPSRPAPWVVLGVEDTGHGMSESVAGRVFEPFFSTRGSGRGLGMASVLGILRQYGGGFSIRSRPGHGTRFCILLPMAE